jgi:hypothetical protein
MGWLGFHRLFVVVHVLDADIAVLGVQMFEDLECRDGCVAQAWDS